MSCCRYIALWVVALIGSTNALGSIARSEDIYTLHHPIHKIAVIDDDGRMTEEEYAQKKGVALEEIQNRFAATGNLRCGNLAASAQLTGARDIIATAAHIFFDGKTCRRKTSPAKCSFTVKIGNSETTSEVSELVAIGFNCPIIPKQQTDWAVLKLKKPIDGVRPYALPYPDEIVNEGDAVITVAGSSDDFDRVDKQTGKKFFTKSIEHCRSRKSYFAGGEQVFFESDCDFSNGASGGSILRERKRYDVLMAIHVSSDKTDALLAKAVRRGFPNRGAYKTNKWATYNVPLAGEFFRTVERAVGGAIGR